MIAGTPFSQRGRFNVGDSTGRVETVYLSTARFSRANRETPDQTVRDGLSNTSQHPFDESSSPPSPTTEPDLPQRL